MKKLKRGGTEWKIKKTTAELDEITIEVINLLADKSVTESEANYISENIPRILQAETKEKRID